MKNQRTRTKNSGSFGELLKSRDSILFLIFLFLILVVVVRMYYLQIVKFEEFNEIANKQHNNTRNLLPKRGEIFLKNGEGLYSLAINREYFTAYISPKDIPDDEIKNVTDQLVENLKIDRKKVEKKIQKRDRGYEILKHKISDEEKKSIEEKNITGLHFEVEKFKNYRFYPGGELASQVVGFIGSDGNEYKGRYGIEAYFEDELSGEAGEVKQRQNARGGWMSSQDREVISKYDGTDFVLTIEYTVQYEIERILKKAIEEYEAESGSISVIDPKTGKILALANYPTFDPNNYSQVENIKVFANPVVTEAYESGSVFKSITMAIGLDDGKITPESTYEDHGSVKTYRYEDSIKILDYEIFNAKKKIYGLQTMTQVLEKSINTGVIHVEKLVGNKKFRDYLQRFDFNNRTGIELPVEARGNVSNLKNLKSEIEFYTAAYGQGITMTQLQLLVAYSALANGGNIMKPQIVEKKIFSDKAEEIVEAEIVHRVISEKSSREISQMLRSVVANGHGKSADVPGYLVGGKTGTAEVASKNEKGYLEDRTIVTFAGYAPINDPKFTVVVKIDNPKNIWATTSAAPTFGKVMKYLLDFYDVEPTEEIIIEEEEKKEKNIDL
ncbi:MAG: penicillin-binding protein 2 [Candidatus Moranbacteria bacterium]|nr:penicillin-binding protein 2 [Candidatus Moranbacteria bacterium]